jgi:hypothetical protein
MDNIYLPTWMLSGVRVLIGVTVVNGLFDLYFAATMLLED